MNAHTKVSAKGQVVIPKDVRERQALAPGQILDVVETAEGILLKPRRKKKDGLTLEEALASIRSLPRYEGPPVSMEDMNRTLAEQWSKSGARGDW